MNRDERFAETHLLFRGFTDIVHEPDGKIPPDFLVNRSIAVEVRRLNQNASEGLQRKGLEETAIPLERRLTQFLGSFGPGNRTHFVGLQIGRPIPKWHSLRPSVEAFLKGVAGGLVSKGTRRAVASNITMDYIESGPASDHLFELGIVDDDDEGGWLIPLMADNLRIVVQEKTEKSAQYRPRYPEWWLVLIDYIGFGSLPCSAEDLRAEAGLADDWDKIVLVHPENRESYYEL